MTNTVTDGDLADLHKLMGNMSSAYNDPIQKLITFYEQHKGMEWVSVDDEKPPIGKEVICYGNYFNGGSGYVLASRLAGDTKKGWDYTYTCFFVTHWMHRPPLPKAGESE